MRKQGIFFIIIFKLVSLSFLGAQTLEELIEFADEQYEAGNFLLAAKEYQRARFFGDKLIVPVLEEKTGNCYFHLQNFEQAKTHYYWASQLYANDSLQAESAFKKASCEIIGNNYHLALMDLLSMNEPLTHLQQRKKDYMTGLCYFRLEDFKLSEKYLLQSIGKDSIHISTVIEDIFKNKKNLYRPNPKTATWLSVFIPGSGQLYAGDFKNSLNSMVLTAGLVGLSIYIATQYGIIDALVSIFPWVQRYYMGGYQHAEEIAIKKREERRMQSFQKISSLINF